MWAASIFSYCHSSGGLGCTDSQTFPQGIYIWHPVTVEFEGKIKVVTENQIQYRDKLPRRRFTGMACLARSVGGLYDPFYVEIELPQISSKSRRFQKLLQSSVTSFFINSMFWSIAFMVVRHTLSLSERICVRGATWHINGTTIVACLALRVLWCVSCCGLCLCHQCSSWGWQLPQSTPRRGLAGAASSLVRCSGVVLTGTRI